MPQTADELEFPSRIDAWLVIVFGLAFAALLIEAGVAFQSNRAEGVVVLGVVAAMVGLLWVFGVPCRYTLTADHLLIRSGIVRLRIPYQEITRVEPSRSLWAAPALSLRRVKVSCGGRFQLVSPRDRDRFIELLEARARAARSALGSGGGRG